MKVVIGTHNRDKLKELMLAFRVKNLDIELLSKSYGPIKALNEVSFSLSEGEYASLLGPNGAGKTTLFQILTGLFVSEQGNALINNFNMRNQAINALAHIGVVFQQITLDMDLTVMENLKFHSNLHGINNKEFNKRSSRNFIWKDIILKKREEE